MTLVESRELPPRFVAEMLVGEKVVGSGEGHNESQRHRCRKKSAQAVCGHVRR